MSAAVSMMVMSRGPGRKTSRAEMIFFFVLIASILGLAVASGNGCG